MDNMFLKPEKPFLLMFEDSDKQNQIEWFSDEEEFKERIVEVKESGFIIIDAIEIGSYRDVAYNSIDNTLRRERV